MCSSENKLAIATMEAALVHAAIVDVWAAMQQYGL